MTWKCQCDQPGECPTLQRHMTPRQHATCRREAEGLTPAQCDAHIARWLAAAQPAHVPTPAAPALPIAGVAECPHRGEEIRRQTCGTCSGLVKIKVFSCAAHGECSLAPQTLPGVRSCLTCSDRPVAKPRYVRTAELVADTYALASRLPPDISGIIGVSRSGLTPASLLAQHLHLPLWILRQDANPAQPDSPLGDITPAGNGWRIHDRPHKDGPLLVVDDTQMTGRSIKRAREVVRRELAGRKVLYSAVYRNPTLPTGSVDYHAISLSQPHFLEWNLFNSVHLPHTAFDLDGVLTVDGTNEPWHLPRKGRVRLIITGRSETDRVGTLAWLHRWGVRVDRLVMFPGKTPADPLVIAAYKAEHFAAAGRELPNYIESCPTQAREIARLSGKLVICPTTAEVF